MTQEEKYLLLKDLSARLPYGVKVEYENKITQNPLNYRSYKYLIPESKTSLGLKKVELIENPKYRVSTYADFFNKTENSEKPNCKSLKNS